MGMEGRKGRRTSSGRESSTPLVDRISPRRFFKALGCNPFLFVFLGTPRKLKSRMEEVLLAPSKVRPSTCTDWKCNLFFLPVLGK